MKDSRSYLRGRCDDYFDPKKYICGGGYTMFHNVDRLAYIREKAKTALNFYNKKKRKNFALEKVVKVNHLCLTKYCLTFWAQRHGNDERRLFRGVVSQGNVLLCEIKDGDDEITIPAGHEEYAPRKLKFERDDFTRERIQNAPDCCDVSSEDDSEDDDSEDDDSEDE